MTFGRPTLEQATQWLTDQGHQAALPLLALTGGTPIRAIEEFEKGRLKTFDDIANSLFENSGDFLALAGRWETHLKKEGGLKMDELVAMIQKALFDLASLKLTGQLRFFASREQQAKAISSQADSGSIMSYYNELQRARALASHPLNPRLFMDDIAARYLRAIAPVRS